MRRFIFIIAAVIVLAIVSWGWFQFFFVFGEGPRAGELNYIMKKGYVWKTYEAKIIQVGFKGGSGSFQSNEFQFSVEDERVARQLMANSGKWVNVHYREYKGALPWRGMSRYVVDSVISVSNSPTGTTLP
ncbi:hypothetical protein MKQ68_19535 [Chitinophaga horti]|uniref:6-phosphogluconate dehydrogenase n=1 Tax=Chitinophaga horti TaxID=2920382 RepID=A0ABY6J2B1_9BACT|nr:hypothetical protein [Chitinophaga horti]UYQ92282.1 hypothetical protein MKQ68_19535 [Chitinophaga horti]